MERYYLAYGSNLSVRQMLNRCPDAVYVGTTELKDWRLMFRGSGSGYYLTIEPAKGYKVPCLVWKVSEYDEAMLDRYEGFPSFYKKVDFKTNVAALFPSKGKTKLDAFAYMMTGNRPSGAPTEGYWATCLEGYERFGFEDGIMEEAYFASCGGCDD